MKNHKKGDSMNVIYRQKIIDIDKVICRYIGASDFSPRGAVSQDVLAQLRNFLEHIMLKLYEQGNDIDMGTNFIDFFEIVESV